jgi:hypothetical protein
LRKIFDEFMINIRKKSQYFPLPIPSTSEAQFIIKTVAEIKIPGRIGSHQVESKLFSASLINISPKLELEVELQSQ